MTEEAIVGKLRTALQKKIASECQVVYVLVEIRKLLDFHQQTKRFNILNLYCNWAVHISLDRDAAQNLVIELNRSYSRLDTGEKAEYGFKGLWNYLSFDHFRKQFRGFLASHNLPTTICEDVEWQDFLHYYSLVIQDCPLECSGSSNAGNLSFDKIVLSASTVTNIPKTGSYVQITWRLYRQDRLISDWNCSLGANASRALIGRRMMQR